jgi:MFS family permease
MNNNNNISSSSSSSNNKNNTRERSSSLLAEALKFPSLDHKSVSIIIKSATRQKNNNSNRSSSTSSSTYNPSTTTIISSSSSSSSNNSNVDADTDTDVDVDVDVDNHFYNCVNNNNNISEQQRRTAAATTIMSPHTTIMKTRMMESTTSSFFETSRTSNTSSDNLMLYDDDGDDDDEGDVGTTAATSDNNMMSTTTTTTTTTKPLSNTSSLSICSSGAGSSGAISNASSNISNNSKNSLIDADDSLFPRHSDFTIPTSNHVMNQLRRNKNCSSSDTSIEELQQPPLIIPYSNNNNNNKNNNNTNNNNNKTNNNRKITTATTTDKERGGGGGGRRRSILGSNVGKKYHTNDNDRKRMSSVSARSTAFRRSLSAAAASSSSQQQNQNNSSSSSSSSSNNNNKVRIPTTTKEYGSMAYPLPSSLVVTMPSTTTTMTMTTTAPTPTDNVSIQQNHNQHQQEQKQKQEQQGPPSHYRRSSRMTPKICPVKEYPSYCHEGEDNNNNNIINDNHNLNGNNNNNNNNNNVINNIDTDIDNINSNINKNLLLHNKTGASASATSCVAGTANNNNNAHVHVHESVHLQSLLLGLAFMVIWLPNNAMAPNLTQMAIFFGMNETERDVYLGSYCALALGVFSLPLSGLLGFMADFYSRKYLFLACIILGSLSSAWSGWAPNYMNLFLARLCSGGCMSGSVPVAFSLLGDLFTKEERNAASSGLTSMMGLGIILGQIYAGEVGPTRSWQYPFYVSAFVQLIAAVMIALWVAEPIRGGKEHALQSMLKSGTKYEQKLTLKGFIHAMHKNASNWILLWQGFLTSLPWGIVFVFLNDFLSQEKGFSVQQATFLVMLFGVGCAIGGITGGYLGQFFMRGNRSHLPIFMGVSTFLGIFPFIALLNSDFPYHSGYKAKVYTILGGLIASLPSVNIRPCIINVNPPESRGAALTAGNLFVTLGRGIGPSCIVLLGSIFHFSRQMSFTITLSVFWTISAIQLLFLAKTLPNDQDAMEEKLVQYAAAAQGDDSNNTMMVDEEEQVTMSPVKARETTNLIAPKTPENRRISTHDDDEDYIMNSPGFTLGDAKAARRSLLFVKLGIQELGEEITHKNQYCRGCETVSPSDSRDEINNIVSSSSSNNVNNGEFMGTDNIIPEDLLISEEEINRRRDVWVQQQQEQNHYYSDFKSERED